METENTESKISRFLSSFGCLMMVTVLLITVLSRGFSARAIEIDGLLKEKMWTEQQPFTRLKNGDEPNCSVDYAQVYVCFDEKNYITYIGCRFVHQAHSELTEETLSGFAVRVEDTDFLVALSPNVEEINGDAYRIQVGAHALSDTSTTAEALIGQKYGFGNPLHVQLRFYDADGIPSNVYTLEIPSPIAATNPVGEEPLGMIIATQASTTKAVKTTKPTTSRTKKATDPTTQKTTVEKTTKEKTTKEKTTKEKTTKVKKTKAAKTTKAKTTKEKTTKAKTTKQYKESSDNEQLLREVLAEQEKTRNMLYIGIGALIVAVFAFCSCILKKKDS
ncbi:MAG TPA: hypothetical protein DDY98_09345 [Ruminococcaceae bacterium]|nr:hypothetical protein [Oscillospiraceae bacterium]